MRHLITGLLLTAGAALAITFVATYPAVPFLVLAGMVLAAALLIAPARAAR